MPEVSVVVPARNVESYVGAVLDDLQRQVFSDFEAIVVDDGSTDTTVSTVARFVENDRRFSLLSSHGAGVSTARNLGIAEASGAFLAFVDADDRLSPNYLQALHASATATGSDLVSCNAQRLEGSLTSPSMLHQKACTKPLQATHIAQAPQLVWDTTVWNKLWRRELWDRANLRYADGRWLNDFLPCITAHIRSRQVDVLNTVLYYWRVRDDPTTSITDRRLTDPEARYKSFEDRMVAIRQARQLLADQVGEPLVLHEFDHRLLYNDLPIYLPYFSTANEDYQSLVLGTVHDFLEHFGIDSNRFRLGPLLHAAYQAIQAKDASRLAAVLHEKTEVALDAGGAPSVRFVRTDASPTVHGPPPPAQPPEVDASHQAYRISATGHIHRVEVDRARPAHLTLHGAVRIRCGRSDVTAPWSVAATLTAGRPATSRIRRKLARVTARLPQRLLGRARVAGPPVPLPGPPDRALHPLVRSGWRPFTATLDVASVVSDSRARDWTLGLELRGGGRSLPVRASLSPVGQATFPWIVPVSRGVALTPGEETTDLQLLRVGAPLILRSAAVRESDVVVSLIGDLEGSSLWFQSRDGKQRTTNTAAADETSLPLPSPDHATEYELWYSGPAGTGRVLAAPDLVTIHKEAHETGAEVVIGPQSNGTVALRFETSWLHLEWMSLGEAPGTLAIGGSGNPHQVGCSRLTLSCLWTDKEVDATVESLSEGWRASFSATELAHGDISRTHVWCISIEDQAGNRMPPTVAPDVRSRLPLGADAEDSIYLSLDEKGSPVLSLSPDPTSDLWPKLRRVRRSLAVATDPSQPNS